MPQSLSYLQDGADLEIYCFPDFNESCVKYSHSVATQTVLYLLLVFAMSINLLGNSVVIISICHFKQLHTPTNILVMSLAVVDLLLGLTVMPFSMVRSVDGCWYYGKEFCFLHSSCDICFNAASIFHLISIAIDRYQAVCHPLQYPTRVTKPVAWFMVSVSWTAAVVYSYSLLFTKASEDSGFTNCLGSCSIIMNAIWAILCIVAGLILPCSVMVYLYVKILFISKMHARKIEGIKQCRNDTSLTKDSKRVKHENKAAKTLGIVVGAFNFCWMPYFLTCVFNSFINFATPLYLSEFFGWLGNINSSLNPIIYGLFYPWFRKAFYLIVTLRIFRSNSSDIKLHA